MVSKRLVGSLHRTAAAFLAAALLGTGCGPAGEEGLSGEVSDGIAGVEEVGVSDEVGSTSDELSSTTLVGSIWAYSTTDGSNSGPRQAFGPGTYLANAGELAGVGNDLIRLLEIGPAMRVRACQHETPSGNTCTTYENLTGSNKRVSVGTGISRLDVRALVVAYRDPNYSGVATGFEVGRHEVALGDFGAVGNDTISSMRLAPGLSARLCSDDPERTVGGTCVTYTGSISSLPSSINDRGSWMEVRPGTTGFRDANFLGIRQSFSAGVHPVSSFSTLGNDTLTSVQVAEGVSSRICSDDPNNTVGGVCVTFNKSSPQVPSNLDNRASWMENRHTVVLQPLNDQSIAADTITLRGYATAANGAGLTGTQLAWYSSVDGFLGNGAALTVRLSKPTNCSYREHVISLVATDSRGVQMTTRRTVYTYVIC